MKWINANNEKPEDGADVFINFMWWDYMDFMAVVTYEDGAWFDYSGTEYKDITHWMPLPEPPKRKD